jgi:hypothetical protein
MKMKYGISLIKYITQNGMAVLMHTMFCKTLGPRLILSTGVLEEYDEALGPPHC